VFLYQPTSGYCYNSDSIFLYDFIRRCGIKGRVLDVGCGVGILSLLLGRDFPIAVSVVDKQEKMLAYAKHNFAINGMPLEAHLGDFTSDFHTDKRFDYIISNPPFYDGNTTQTKDEHLNIARYAHHLPLAKLIEGVKRWITPRGWFIFCYDARYLDAILYHLKASGFAPEKIQFVHSTPQKEAKLVMIAARNNAKGVSRIQPPLVVFDEKRNYTPLAQEAFDCASTHSIKGDF